MIEPSITCPDCGRTSYNPGDIENRYCAACDQFHVRMFYRTMVHVAAIDPLRIHCLSLEMDEAGNFDGCEPFVVKVLDDSMPAHTSPGDFWTGYLNLNSFQNFGARDRLQIRTIERVPYFDNDPNNEIVQQLGPHRYTYQYRPEKRVGLRWVPSNDIILKDFTSDAEGIEAGKVLLADGHEVVYVKRENETEVLGWWWTRSDGKILWADGLTTVDGTVAQ